MVRARVHEDFDGQPIDLHVNIQCEGLFPQPRLPYGIESIRLVKIVLNVVLSYSGPLPLTVNFSGG